MTHNDDLDFFRAATDPSYGAEIERERLAALPPGYRDGFTPHELETFRRRDGIERTASVIDEVAIGDRRVTVALVIVNAQAFAELSDDRGGRSALIPIRRCWRYRDRGRELTPEDLELLNRVAGAADRQEIRYAIADLEATAETWFTGAIVPENELA
jgi:hypothetical protein